MQVQSRSSKCSLGQGQPAKLSLAYKCYWEAFVLGADRSEMEIRSFASITKVTWDKLFPKTMEVIGVKSMYCKKFKDDFYCHAYCQKACS